MMPGDLVDKVFPEPENPPAGWWEVAGDDSTWRPDPEGEG